MQKIIITALIIKTQGTSGKGISMEGAPLNASNMILSSWKIQVDDLVEHSLNKGQTCANRSKKYQ